MRKPVLATLAALVLASSCSRVEREPTIPDQSPQASPSPSPAQELAIEASIMSAVVADDCQTAELARPDPTDLAKAKGKPLGIGKADMAMKAKRACEQSRVQILLTSGPGAQSARIELVSVALNEDGSGKHLQDLVARNPQVWSATESRYLPWDRTVSPSQELRTSFDLTAPNWVAIGNGNPWSTQGMTFRLSVVLRIDGKDRSVDFQIGSPFIMREPNVKT